MNPVKDVDGGDVHVGTGAEGEGQIRQLGGIFADFEDFGGGGHGVCFGEVVLGGVDSGAGVLAIHGLGVGVEKRVVELGG